MNLSYAHASKLFVVQSSSNPEEGNNVLWTIFNIKSYSELRYDISKKAIKEFFYQTIRYFLRESDSRKGASVLQAEPSVPW